jgi:hypothetical protein
VIDGPQSVVFEQAANRLPTEQAVIQALLSPDTSRERHEPLAEPAGTPA